MRPSELSYTKDHEWLRSEGDEVVVGITDYAAGELGDIVYLDLPEVGRELKAGDAAGTIETVKAVESIYAPVDGVVTAVNEELGDHPELVNEDPFGKGWILRMKGAAQDQTELLDAQGYQSLLDDL